MPANKEDSGSIGRIKSVDHEDIRIDEVGDPQLAFAWVRMIRTCCPRWSLSGIQVQIRHPDSPSRLLGIRGGVRDNPPPQPGRPVDWRHGAVLVLTIVESVRAEP